MLAWLVRVKFLHKRVFCAIDIATTSLFPEEHSSSKQLRGNKKVKR